MKKLAFFVFGIFYFHLAAASFYTAGDIYKGSVSYARVAQGNPLNADAQESAVMIGYVTATADWASSSGVVCLPQGATIRQLVAVTRKYLEANPEVWTFDANVVVSTALFQAFPCKKYRRSRRCIK